MKTYLIDFEGFKDFLTKPQGLIFAMESVDKYIFETVVNFCCMRCEVVKTTPEDNLIFIESWISKNPVIRWVMPYEDPRPKVTIEVKNG